MCKFFSAIVVDENKKLLWDYDIDSHAELLEKFHITDTTVFPNFVSVEFTPPNGDVFGHDFTEWIFKVDQDLIPDWFEKEKAKALCLSSVKKLIDERFIINRTIDEIKSGRWWVKDGVIKDFWGGTLKDFWGGTLERFWGGTLERFRGGTLTDFWGGTLKDFWGGTLERFWGGTLEHFRGGTLKDFRGGTLKHFMDGTLEHFRGGTLEHFMGGTLKDFWGGTLEHFRGGTLTDFKTNGTGVLYKLSEKKIIVANPEVKLELFKKGTDANLDAPQTEDYARVT